MILSFSDRETEALFSFGRVPAKWAKIENVVLRKLDMLNAAVELNDLRAPPGNRLEALRGDRAEQFSIRINDKWRICFVWTPQGPSSVEIVDYH